MQPTEATFIYTYDSRYPVIVKAAHSRYNGIIYLTCDVIGGEADKIFRADNLHKVLDSKGQPIEVRAFLSDTLGIPLWRRGIRVPKEARHWPRK